jgi:hypothetical protein
VFFFIGAKATQRHLSNRTERLATQMGVLGLLQLMQYTTQYSSIR